MNKEDILDYLKDLLEKTRNEEIISMDKDYDELQFMRYGKELTLCNI